LAFAVSQFYFGAIDPETGTTDPNAWRRFGFDIDGVHTTDALALSDSPGTCRANPGGPADVLADGVDGRDNNYGSQLPGILLDFGVPHENPEVNVMQGIAQGRPTFLVALGNINEGPDDPKVEVGLWVTAEGGPPFWEGHFRYDIDDRTTIDKSSIQPLMSFEKAYMADNVIVTGEVDAPAETPILIPFDPADGLRVLTPLAFTLTFELDETHQHILSSTLSMVLSVSDQVALFLPFMAQSGFFGCGAEELFAIVIEDRTDLRSDRPSFLDSSSTEFCDATSIAMRLDWQPVRLPLSDNLITVEPKKPPCPVD
jgi:hypothetical protein